MSKGCQAQNWKSTETAEQSLWELMNSRPTFMQPAWYQTRPSAYSWQLCSLICVWGPWQWDPGALSGFL